MNEEYIGHRYNKLVITSIAEPFTTIQGYHLARVNCLCDCGNTRTVLFTCLKRGLVKSCGCYRTQMKKRVDLIGQTFGKLTVIAEGKPMWSGSKYRRMWICRCECGNIKTIQHSNLVSLKGSRSCGCVRSGGRPGHNNLAGNRYGRLLVIRKAN